MALGIGLSLVLQRVVAGPNVVATATGTGRGIGVQKAAPLRRSALALGVDANFWPMTPSSVQKYPGVRPQAEGQSPSTGAQKRA